MTSIQTAANISTPFVTDEILSLKTGDIVLLSGEIYTARDAAHKRMTAAFDGGGPPPFKYEGNAVYYAGPCPAPPGKLIGSVGPTTSSRMDAYAPRLIKEGLRVMIGKGFRSAPVIDAIREYKGIYLTAVGGAGAYYAMCVCESKLVAYEDLGAEAVYRLTVRDMPLIVAIDSSGKSIFSENSDKGTVRTATERYLF